MSDKHDMAKMGLAFAVGVSLSASYVALGLLAEGPEVVVVHENCPEQRAHEAPQLNEGVGEDDSPTLERVPDLELAALAGEDPIPAGSSLWVGLDGLWFAHEGGARHKLLELDRGRLPPGLPAMPMPELAVSGPVVLWLDHRLPGASLIELLAALDEAGVEELALAVAGDAGEARSYGFELAQLGEFVERDDGPWGLGLSLRLRDAGGVAAWMRPLIEGEARLGAPAAVPLELGEESSETCRLGSETLPDPAQLSSIEAQLCGINSEHKRERGRLGVEWVIAAERSVGELLALRAMDARSEDCRGPSILATPALEPTKACEGARSPEDMLALLDASPRAPAGTFAVKARVSGGRAKDSVRAVVRAEIGDIRECYNQGLTSRPDLAGRVLVDFVIVADGAVSSARVGEGTTLGDAEVEACIAAAISSWTFPAPREGSTVKVSYPFVLSPG